MSPIIPPLDVADPVVAPIGEADPTVVFRRNLGGAAGLHALVVGVSDYLNLPDWGNAGGDRTFGMKKLRSPALSAYRIAQWLIKNQNNLAKPVASLRLLLCASALEKSVEGGLGNGAASPFLRPTLANIMPATEQWRKDADSGQDGITFFFYSGHGVQLTTRDSVVLMFDDFAQKDGSAFLNTTEFSNIVGFMNRSSDATDIASTQFYFIDACRSELPARDAQRARPTIIFDELPGADTRARPAYFATAGGMEAFAPPGEMSYFSRALIAALETGVDQPIPIGANKRVYPINVSSLANRISACLTMEGLEQGCFLGGIQKPAILRFLNDPPPVSFYIDLAPPGAIADTKIRVVDGRGNLIKEFGPPPPAHPYLTTVPVGIYALQACKPPTAVPIPIADLFPVGQGLGRWPVVVGTP